MCLVEQVARRMHIPVKKVFLLACNQESKDADLVADMVSLYYQHWSETGTIPYFVEFFARDALGEGNGPRHIKVVWSPHWLLPTTRGRGSPLWLPDGWIISRRLFFQKDE